jgi:ABC-2 type transport system permease protein
VRLVPNPAYFVLAFIVIFLASGGFAAISILVASFMKTRERFMGIGQAIIMPPFFVRNARYRFKFSLRYSLLGDTYGNPN